MKKILLLLIAITIGINCFAQKGGAKAGGGGSSTSGGSSSAQIQTGYSYIIRRAVFMQYIYHKMIKKTVTMPTFIILNSRTVSVPVRKGSLIQLPGPDSLLVQVKNNGNMTLESGSIIQLPAGVMPTAYIGNSNFQIKGGTYKNGLWQPLSIDSVMWVADTASVNYLARRLRVGIAQDSGDLQVDINTKRLWRSHKKWEEEVPGASFEIWVTNKKEVNEYIKGKIDIDTISYLKLSAKKNILKKTIKKSVLINKWEGNIIGWYVTYRVDTLIEYKNCTDIEIMRYNYNSLRAIKTDTNIIDIEVFNPKEETVTLTSNEIITGREISYSDSLKNFHLIIDKSSVVGDHKYFRKVGFNKMQYGVTSIPFQFRWGYNSCYRTATTPTVALTPSQPNQPGAAVPSSATTSINGAIYFGWEWGHTKFFNDPNKTYTGLSIVPAVFAGPTIIALSSANTFTNSPGGGNVLTTNSNTFNQLGVSLGGSINVNYQNFNIGVFLGWDIPVGANDARNWVYAKQPWIGFGIGFNLAMLVSGDINSAK